MSIRDEDLRTTATVGLGENHEGGLYPGWHGDMGNIAVTLDTLIAIPFATGVHTMTAVQYRVHWPNSIGIHLGLYDTRSDGYPETRLVDTAVMEPNSTWAVTSTVLKGGGLFYFVILASSTSAFVTGATAAPGPPTMFGVEPDLNGQATCVTASYAFGSLPATFPTSGGLAETAPVLGILFGAPPP